jgi:hypothetical protein
MNNMIIIIKQKTYNQFIDYINILDYLFGHFSLIFERTAPNFSIFVRSGLAASLPRW